LRIARTSASLFSLPVMKLRVLGRGWGFAIVDERGRFLGLRGDIRRQGRLSGLDLMLRRIPRRQGICFIIPQGILQTFYRDGQQEEGGIQYGESILDLSLMPTYPGSPLPSILATQHVPTLVESMLIRVQQ
jgi:hypothetical protein